MIAFISGHLDVTEEEFCEHYLPQIINAYVSGDSFIVGDARGADAIAQMYLDQMLTPIKHIVPTSVTVYHMFESPRNNVGDFKTVGGFASDKERDEAMTTASNYDIAWVRPGRKKSGTAQNIKRREKIETVPVNKRLETYDFITKPLNEYHTKQLLDMRRRLRQAWDEYNGYDYYGFVGEPNTPKPNITILELQTELATRPHIPNKLENKALRQEAAKKKR